MSKGYSMLSKELMDSEDYFSERFTRMQAYMDLCLLAAWKDRKFMKRGQVVELKAGQLAKSEEELADRWKWSRNTVRKYLNEQQIIGNIEQQKSRLITIITVKFGLNIAQQIEQQTPSKTAQQIEQQQEDTYIHNKENNKDATASLQLEFEEPEIKSKVSDFDFDAFLDYFNKTLKANNSIIPSLRKIDERRKNVIHARIKDYGTDAIYEVVQKASVSSFMNGGGSKGWKANFDWMFGPDNFRKVLEGNYDDMDTKKPNVIGNYGFSGLQFPKDPRHGDIFNNHYYDANEDRWIADGEKDRLGRVFSIQMKKWLI